MTTNHSSRASQTGNLALAIGLAWALPVAALAETGCSQGPGASTRSVVVAPADAPLEILAAPASAATETRFGITSWRAFLGLERIVVEGYRSTGSVVPGFELEFAEASEGRVTLQMLYGSRASLVATVDGEGTGALSDDQLELTVDAFLDFEASNPPAKPAAAGLENAGALAASGLHALDTAEEQANCHKAVTDESSTALVGSTSCVLMAMTGGGTGMMAKILGMLGRAGTGLGAAGCMQGLMAANDISITCNTHDGCIVLPEQTPGIICPDADAGPADAGPDEEPPCPGTMGCKAGLITRPEAGATEAGAAQGGDAGSGELGGGTCNNSEHTAPTP
jgi:hypothetical protein